MGKGKRRSGVKAIRIDYDAASAQMPDVARLLADASLRYTSSYEATVQALHACYSVMEREGAEVASLRHRQRTLQAVIDLGPQESTVTHEQIDNPMLTNGLRDAALAGEPIPLQVDAAKDMALLIGGFARVHGRTHLQTLAAIRFRDLHERAQLGGAKAQDYSKVKVDSFGNGEDRTAEIGAAARQEYQLAVKALGMIQSNIVEQVVVYDRSIRQLAASMGLGNSGFGLRKAKLELLTAINLLVDHFKIKPGAGASPKLTGWRDRHVPFSSMMESTEERAA